jgi:AcrR family transcriptional regulator
MMTRRSFYWTGSSVSRVVMPSARPSREEVLTTFRRTALIDAARRVFGGHGFDGATMEAIAAAAQVAKGTIYLYYRSKRAIYDATLEAGLAEIDRLTEARIRQAASIKDAIAGFIAVRTAYFQERPDFFRMYVAEVAGQIIRQGSARRTCRAMLERQTKVLQKAIADAVARGEIRHVDPAATAMAVFDMTRGLTARRLVMPPTGDVRRENDLCTDLIWNGIATRRGHK